MQPSRMRNKPPTPDRLKQLELRLLNDGRQAIVAQNDERRHGPELGATAEQQAEYDKYVLVDNNENDFKSDVGDFSFLLQQTITDAKQFIQPFRVETIKSQDKLFFPENEQADTSEFDQRMLYDGIRADSTRVRKAAKAARKNSLLSSTYL